MQPVLIFFSVFFMTSCILSCKKNSSDTTAPVIPLDAKTILLTKGLWYKMAEGADTNQDGIIDVVSARFALPCNQDDRASFTSDGNLVWYEGPTKCDPAGADTYSLKWHFTDLGIYMIDRDSKIAVLNDSSFVVYYEENTGTKTIRNTMEFRH